MNVGYKNQAHISVTILVKNGERHLKAVLDALLSFEEVILYDTGSTDQTLLIAKTYSNVTIYQKPFIGFGAAHNAATALATKDWILSVDSDEVLSQQLVEEILCLNLTPNTLYAIPFYNYFNGRQIRWCGWYPESHVRLYNRKETAFSEVLLHESVIQKGQKVIQLTHPLYHYSYDSISDFLIKMERYSTLFAKQYRYKRKSSLWIAILHMVSAFFKSFVLKRGFLGGFEGFLISSCQAHTTFYKYLKLYQENKCS